MTRVRRFCCALVAALALGSALPAGGAPEFAPEQIVANLAGRNAALTSYQARIDLHLHTGIPFLNPYFEGITYFKQPDRHELVFTSAPPYAKGFDKLYSGDREPAGWSKLYNCSVDGERAYAGHPDVVLRLVERQRGSLDHVEVLIDTRRWVVDQMTYLYSSGGKITIDQSYRDEGGFTLLAEEHASIAMPFFPRANADARYSKYQLNVAIDDRVFTERETKNIGVGSK